MQVPWPEHAFGQQPASVDGKSTLSENRAPRVAGSIHLEGAIVMVVAAHDFRDKDPISLSCAAMLFVFPTSAVQLVGLESMPRKRARKSCLGGRDGESKTDSRDGRRM